MPPGLATTCAGNATWRCLIGGFRGILDHARWGGYKDLRLSGGFRKDPRPRALGRAAVFRLNVPPILLLTTRAGVNIWRCLIGGFRGILDHARWGGYKDLRLSGGFRKDPRPRALGRAKVLGSVSSHVTLMGRSLPACDYGYHLGHSAGLASTFATRPQSDTLSAALIASSRCFPRAKAVGEDKHRR